MIDRRIGILFALFVALLGVAVVRASYLGVVRAGPLQRVAATQQVTKVTLPADRGAITDRNGVQLALSQSVDDIAADPYLIKDPVRVAGQLAPLLDTPQTALVAALSKRHTGFQYLAHLVPPDRSNAIMRLRIDGLTAIPQVRRVYPRAWAASQVLGSVHANGHGYTGIEYRYDNVLQGTTGTRRIVNDAIGQPIGVDDVRAAEPGKTVQLTIDSALQDEVEQVLAGVGAQYSPKGATAIAMDPSTGAILALANWPRVDANDVAGAPSYATRDRAVVYGYEPGSTFKAVTVAGALQDGIVAPDTQLGVPSVLQVADRQIHDADSHGDETLSVAQILQRSSNIGADEIGMKLGKQRFDYWVHRFGFGAPTGIDLAGEQSGIVLPWWRYSGSSMGNLPIGQGELVTPIQMATAYSAIADGGILRAPHVVGRIGGKALQIPRGHRIISPAAAAELRDMLRGVLADGGTASGAAIPGYDLAGKTGTANVVVNGHYSSTAFYASFIGFVPASHPRLLVAVVVDEPQGTYSGGSVAAPAFQKIVGWAVPYLGLSPK